MAIGGQSVMSTIPGIVDLLRLCVINLDTPITVSNLITSYIYFNNHEFCSKGAIPLYRWQSFGFAALKVPIWLDRVLCTGYETSILNCTHSAIGEIGTSCNHYDDVGVRCLGK